MSKTTYIVSARYRDEQADALFATFHTLSHAEDCARWLSEEMKVPWKDLGQITHSEPVVNITGDFIRAMILNDAPKIESINITKLVSDGPTTPEGREALAKLAASKLIEHANQIEEMSKDRAEDTSDE